jgi:hypothetical protein
MWRYLLVVFVFIKACISVESESGHLLTKVMCSRTTIRQIEARETMQMLKRCIHQKRQRENQLRSARSIEFQQPGEQLMEFEKQILDQFKRVANAPSMLNGKRVHVKVTEIDLRTQSSNKIQCDGNQVIRMKSAVLTSKDFEEKCDQRVENENLVVLNQTCHNEIQTFQIANEL